MLHAHLAFFAPGHRRGSFTDEILSRCDQITSKVFQDFGAELHEFNAETDHVHLLIHYPPKVTCKVAC